MIYKKIGSTDVEISIFAMGGHEYLPDGLSRGFNEDFNLAVRPDYIFEGFGQETRKKDKGIHKGKLKTIDRVSIFRHM
jgi:hypothetical protein